MISNEVIPLLTNKIKLLYFMKFSLMMVALFLKKFVIINNYNKIFTEVMLLYYR